MTMRFPKMATATTPPYARDHKAMRQEGCTNWLEKLAARGVEAFPAGTSSACPQGSPAAARLMFHLLLMLAFQLAVGTEFISNVALLSSGNISPTSHRPILQNPPKKIRRGRKEKRKLGSTARTGKERAVRESFGCAVQTVRNAVLAESEELSLDKESNSSSVQPPLAFGFAEGEWDWDLRHVL